MLTRRILVVLFTLFTSVTAFAADNPGLQIQAAKPASKVNVDRVINEGKVVVSVFDAGENPIFGLGAGDFSITESGRTANIISVQPLAESLDVPRNIVLVLDNSFSMKERRAIGALLAGVDELLKIVRPIDKVEIVVFENFEKIKIKGYDKEVNVKTFTSSDQGELRNFAATAYSSNVITGQTVLFDAMLAGLDFIREAPETEPRFMVVFSDGEDLNSKYKSEDVTKAAQGLKGFNAFAIDYMPDYGTNKFLSGFSSQNRGHIWKAHSETNLVPIFQEVASKMQYYYVVTYLFPPSGSLTAAPPVLKFDEVRVSDAAPVTRLDTPELTVRPAVDTVYGIAKWKVAVSNSKGKVAELEGEGTPATELKVPLPTSDLQSLAAGGDLKVAMQLEDKKGQSMALDAQPVKIEVTKTSARLTVTPSSIKFDEIKVADAAPETKLDMSELTARPVVDSAYGIAKWKVAVSNNKGGVAELAGEGTPAPELKVPLPTTDLQALAAGGDLKVAMQMEDKKGQSMALDAAPVKVEVVKTTAGLAVVPASLTIEEMKTIDASPMLNHVYFDKGSGEIPARYVRFAGPKDTEGFDEHKFRDSLEKYYQVLNIVGKRLTEHPGAAVTLVGCNDNTAEEKGNKKLSEKRADAVRDYLLMAWGIAPERITTEVRNLPAMPSATRLKEGQEENRRVEIRSTEPAILAPIQSTYFTNRIDSPALTVQPDVVSPYGIASWKVAASNTPGDVADLSGEGAPAKEIKIPLDKADLGKLATGGDITVKMEVKDVKGHDLQFSAAPVKVSFIQKSQRLALKEGLKVQEKYALILFDFDKSTIDARNQDIVNTIVARAKTLPDARVEIVGHTDNIGKEDYNIKLSGRRSQAVYDMLRAAYDQDPGDRVHSTGVGPNTPLYDNMSPEARSFNRTVTITLEYLSAE